MNVNSVSKNITARRLCGGVGTLFLFLSLAAFQNCGQISYVPAKNTSNSTNTVATPAPGAQAPATQPLAALPKTPVSTATSSALHQVRYFPGTLNLTTDQSVTLANSTLSFHGDGDLLMFDQNINPVWDANASLGAGACSGQTCTATFQTDGNFVFYKNGTPYLATSTTARGASLLLSDSAPYLQIFDVSGNVLWSSDQAVPPLPGSSPPAAPPAAAAPPTAPVMPTVWQTCVVENSVCNFNGTQIVRYGANGTFVYLTATSSVACNNSVFGDPLPGVVKECDIAQ